MIAFVAAAVLALLYAVRPGVNIFVKEQPPARSAPTDTGVWFVCGTSDQGPLYPVLIQSISDFTTWFGQRATYSLLYDALDTYFREGGRMAWVSRVTGPAAAVATRNLLDAGAAVSLVASAIGPGAYGNNFKVGVVAGTVSGYQLQVTDLANNVLEQSGDLADQAAGVAWGANSAYVRIALGASANNPAVAAAAALAGGTDDRVNITDTQWQAALDRFTVDLGPGQVSFPGRTTDPAHAALLAHATANRRTALLDAPDTPTVATLTTSAQNARLNGRFGGLWAPWIVIPGIVPNTTRTVPPSAVIAGIIARNDVRYNSNVPAAGDRGQSYLGLGLSQAAWTDANRQTLNGQGVNVFVMKFGGVRNYGYRSLTNPSTDPFWLDLGNVRLINEISARGGNIMESFMFSEIDGSGKLFARITGQLTALLNSYYEAGSLYGATPADAFSAVCDTSNNTPTTIANHELHATVAIRASEMAEYIEFDIVKVAVNQPIA